MSTEGLPSLENNGKGEESKGTINRAAKSRRNDSKEKVLSKKKKISDEAGDILTGLSGGDESTATEALRLVRTALSKGRDAFVTELIGAGLVKKLVKVLQTHLDTNVQSKTAKLMAKIAFGAPQNTPALVEGGSCEALLKLIQSSDPKVAEEAVCALANIVEEGGRSRDVVLELGVLPLLETLVKNNAGLNLLQGIARLISNLSKGQNHSASEEHLEAILPTIAALLNAAPLKFDNSFVLMDCCKALSRLTNSCDKFIEQVCHLKVIGCLVEIISQSEDVELLYLALRTLGHIAAFGSEQQVELLLDSRCLGALFHLLMTKDDVELHRLCTWFVSNLAAGTEAQVKAVLRANLHVPIIGLVSSSDSMSQSGAFWVLWNISCTDCYDLIRPLIIAEMLPALSNLLGEVDDSDLISMVLQIFDKVLKLLETDFAIVVICDMLEDIKFLDKLEMLVKHTHAEVYEKATKIMNSYWTTNRDD